MRSVGEVDGPDHKSQRPSDHNREDERRSRR